MMIDTLPVQFWYAIIAVIGVVSILFSMLPITRIIAERARKDFEQRIAERAPERVMAWYRVAAGIGIRAVEQMKSSGQFEELVSLSKQEFNKALKARAVETASRFLKSLGWKNVNDALIADVIEWLIDEEKRSTSPPVVLPPHTPTEDNPAMTFKRSTVTGAERAAANDMTDAIFPKQSTPDATDA